MKTTSEQIKKSNNRKQQSTKPNGKTLLAKQDKVWSAMVAFIEYAVKCELLPKDQWDNSSTYDMEEMLSLIPNAWAAAVSTFEETNPPGTWHNAVMEVYGAKYLKQVKNY